MVVTSRARRTRFASFRSSFRFGRRAWWMLLAMPLALRVLVIAVVILLVWSAVNWTYQVLRKPTELFFPVSGALWKTPPETWRQYGSLFRGHSTAVMTAELLDRSVTSTMARHRIVAATLQQKQDLAAVIHLCGAGPGDAYARRGFRLTPGQKCGDHDVRGYLAQVNAMKRQFVRLAAT